MGDVVVKARALLATLAFALLLLPFPASAATAFQEDWESGLTGWATSGSGMSQDCTVGSPGCSLKMRATSSSTYISVTKSVSIDAVSLTTASVLFRGGRTASDSDATFSVRLSNGGSVDLALTETVTPNNGLNLYSSGYGSTGIFARWSTANTWYRIAIRIDASANTVTAELRNLDGSLVGASTPRGIPATADRITSIGFTTVTWSLSNDDTFRFDTVRVESAADGPRNLAASRGPGAGEVTLTWQAPLVPNGTVTAYKVYRSDTSGGAKAYIGTTDAATLTFKDTGIPAGATRYYTATAVANSESSTSNEVAGTAPSVPGIPMSPSGTRGTARGQVVLAWSPPTDDGGTALTGYKVHRSTSSGGAYTQVGTTDAATRTFTDSGLADGTTYYYKVQATNAAGTGGLTTAFSATPPGPPGAPASPSAARGSVRGEIVVAWSPPSDDGGLSVTGYKVLRAPSSTGTYAPVGATDAATRTFTDTGLADGTAYYYRVKASNDAGDGTVSSYVSARAPGTPGAPGSPGASRGPGRGETTVTWAAPSDDGGLSITGYRVLRAPTSTGTYSLVAILTATDRAFTEGGFADGATVYYKVQASNEAGDGTLTLPIGATTPTTPGAPASPAAARGPERGQITVRWSPPPDDGGLAVTGYRILRANATSGPFVDLGLTDATARAFVDGVFADSVTKYYKVRAANPTGEGPLSPLIAATTPGIPGAPRTPVAASGPGRGQITITWSAPTSDGGLALTGYVVARGASSIGPFTQVGSVDAATLAFTDGGLADGARAYYVVNATNVAGAGPATTAVTATTPVPPDAARSLTATRGPGRGEISLAWSPPTTTGGTSVQYVLERAPGGTSTFTTIATLVGLSTLDSGLPDSTSFTYRVVAQNVAGSGPPSATATVSTATTPGAPSSTALTASGRGSLSVAWNPPVDTGGIAVDAYAVHRATDASGPFLPVATTGAGVRSWTDTGLADSMAYHYRVAAINAVGEGTPGAVVSARTASAPSEPLGLDAQPGNARGEIVVTWFTPAETSGFTVSFKVYAADALEGPFLLVAQGPDTMLVDGGLADGATRYYRVSAVNVVGEGPAAGPVAATTFVLPGAPTDLEASPRLGVPAVGVSWQPPAELGARTLTGYQVYRSVDGGPFLPRAFVAGTTYTDSGVNLLATYQYRVAAVNVVGEGPVSGEDCSRPSPWPEDSCDLPV